LYALLCGSLPFDDENIPNLFKKIKGGIYSLPSHLSEGVRDLIPRMLVVDPMKRITIKEIRQHRWFRVNLAKYLSVPLDDVLVKQKIVDDEALGQVVKLCGIDIFRARDMLATEARNEVQVAYNLILDHLERKRRNEGDAVSDDMLRNLSASSDLSVLSDGSSDGNLVAGGADVADGTALSAGAALSAASVDGGPSKIDMRRSGGQGWKLGKLAAKLANPAAVMHEIYRALGAAGFEWKTLSPYNLKCRYELSPSTSGAQAAASASIKIALQLYKLPDGQYLLDFQNHCGDLLGFIEICKRLMSELQL
jgi:5'-AMP-activated protein kinase catalytic alpha subunit